MATAKVTKPIATPTTSYTLPLEIIEINFNGRLPVILSSKIYKGVKQTMSSLLQLSEDDNRAIGVMDMLQFNDEKPTLLAYLRNIMQYLAKSIMIIDIPSRDIMRNKRISLELLYSDTNLWIKSTGRNYLSNDHKLISDYIALKLKNNELAKMVFSNLHSRKDIDKEVADLASMILRFLFVLDDQPWSKDVARRITNARIRHYQG